MVPFICHCCGAYMSVSAAENPNVCPSCAQGVWEDETDLLTHPVPQSPIGLPIELEHMLEKDEPSIVECFDALQQATRAIAETDDQKSALARRLATPSTEVLWLARRETETLNAGLAPVTGNS